MAKKTPSSPLTSTKLDRAETVRAVQRLDKRISELRQIRPEDIENHWSTASALANKLNASLSEIFGINSIQYNRTEFSWSTFCSMSMGDEDRNRDIRAFKDGVDHAISLLQAEVDILKEQLEEQATGGTVGAPQAGTNSRSQFSANEVFVVHGQDEAAKQEVARFIQGCGLDPKILHELDSSGDTIIEKFERHTANVGYAIVLLTPDDVGGPVGGDLKPRARQNVVAELFYFVGKIGRKRVVALKKGGIEIPSDMAGVVYVDMDSRGAWKQDLVRELRAAGYEGDWGKAVFG